MASREILIVIVSLVLGILLAPAVTSAVDRKDSADIKAAQIRQDIQNGYYTQAEYDCDFDDCSDDDVYLASAQKAIVDYANQSLALIKERWERAQ